MKTLIMAETVNFLSNEIDNKEFQILPHLLSQGFVTKQTMTGINYLAKEEPYVDGVQLTMF